MKLHELTSLAHTVWCDRPGDETPFFADLERFAALVAAAEREACAKVCEEEIKRVKPIYSVTAENCVKAIRARGQK
jgi:hypothetical protein